MRFLALACDYDGTLASDGRVGPAVVSALQRLRESGRRLLLVTGRQLEDLQQVFPELALFDRVVAENGALLYTPETKEERVLADAPPVALIDRLRALEVEPLAVGRVIVATWEPMQTRVLEAIRELGLELQVIFNKGAVMVLPSGVNKASGLQTALEDLQLSAHNAVGVGDAENDHALLASCELGVAVANAVPMLKERADWVTRGARGTGVIELIDALLKDDLAEHASVLTRWDIELGSPSADAGAKPVRLHPWGRRLLLCGASGSGKSTLATAFIEQLMAAKYQLCLVDPEGDYDALPDAIVVGDAQHAPRLDELIDPIRTAKNQVVANLLAVPLDRRAEVLSALLSRLQELRTKLGRPHVIVVDEAHHMLPEDAIALPDQVERLPTGLLLITVHPERIANALLQQIDGLLVVGADAEAAVRSFAKATGREPPTTPLPALAAGQALFWSFDRDTTQLWPCLTLRTTNSERSRHRRKYASGSLGEDKSFYFRGPQGALNLRAQNLAMFVQIAQGVDDATWLHHLAQHDYSRWVHEAIKNDELSAQLRGIEDSRPADPQLSRQRVRSAIESAYTLPA